MPNGTKNTSLPPTAGFLGVLHYSGSKPSSGNAKNVRTYSEPSTFKQTTIGLTNHSAYHEYDSPNCSTSYCNIDRGHTLNRSLIFNYSDIELYDAMEKLLNRGLNYCVLRQKLDLTQILVDFKRFERSALWREFRFESEQGTSEPHILKQTRITYQRTIQHQKVLRYFSIQLNLKYKILRTEMNLSVTYQQSKWKHFQL